MAAARRYAIASYDRTGLARTMYTRPVVGDGHRRRSSRSSSPSSCTPATARRAARRSTSSSSSPRTLIHDIGHRRHGRRLRSPAWSASRRWPARSAAREGVGWRVGRRQPGGPAPVGACRCGPRSAVEIARPAPLSARTATTDAGAPPPWYRRRWFLHAATMWGFLGLLARDRSSTTGWPSSGIKETGTPVPIWYPVRLLGTVAGLPARLRRDDAHHRPLPAARTARSALDDRRLDAPGARSGSPA